LVGLEHNFSDNGLGALSLSIKSRLAVDKETGTIVAGGGAITDDVVKVAVAANFVGIEGLSGIPGTIGAAPVNNIGAYGQEIKNTLTKVRAYDTQTNQFVEITKEDCGFGYRDSVFKNRAHGRYIITKIYLQLKRFGDSYQSPNYPTLRPNCKNVIC